MYMNEPLTSKTYDVWAWFYDYTFGACVVDRQLRAIHQLRSKPGDKVLDIGVGTGMLLPNYPKDVTIVGLDLSAGMLNKAAIRCQEHGLNHCPLVRGDALYLPFAPASFDHVMITHTITVVSNPAKLIAEAQKVLKPGGRLILLNHFLSLNPVVAAVEKALNPIFVKIGWKSDLALEEVLSAVDMTIEYRFQMRMIDLWQIVVLRNEPAPSGNPIRNARSKSADHAPMPAMAH